MTQPQSRPWYREPWPWILMSGPAAVVVAGLATAAIAVASFDGMVADDYYKQGLGINRVIARESRAKELGLAASVAFNEERTRVRVVMGEGTHPASMRLALVHPTLPAQDQSLVLAAIAPGVYEGAMRAPLRGAMHLRLEDVEGRWRIAGDWKTRDDAVRLSP